MILGDVLNFVGYTEVNELAHCISYITESYAFECAELQSTGRRKWALARTLLILSPHSHPTALN